MKRALKEILTGINYYEFETLMKLQKKERVGALLGQVSLYIIFILLFHLAFLPYYDDAPGAKKMTLIVYGLMFIGMQGPSLLTIIIPSSYRYEKLLKYGSYTITFLGSGLLGANISLVLGEGLVEVFSTGPIMSWVRQNIMFSSTPSLEAFSILGIAYFIFLIGIKFSTDAIFTINEKRVDVESEIAAARKIQETINAPIEINEEGFSAVGKVIPAKEVGGDYMEWFSLKPDKGIMVIGDVSGHDTAAGLLMGMTKAAFDTEIKYEADPQKQLASLNEAVCRFSSAARFVTFLTANFNFKEQSITTCNAGHLPMLHYNSLTGKVNELKPKGMLLGVKEDATYASETVNFTSNDIFIGLTDGLVEIRNRSDEEYDLKRLKNLLPDLASKSSFEIFSSIQDSYTAFAGKKGVVDDISLIVVKIN